MQLHGVALNYNTDLTGCKQKKACARAKAQLFSPLCPRKIIYPLTA